MFNILQCNYHDEIHTGSTEGKHLMMPFKLWKPVISVHTETCFNSTKSSSCQGDILITFSMTGEPMC